MEKFVSGYCSTSIHYAVSYCVVGETKKTAIDFGTASLDIERENICLDSSHYLTRLKITNISGSMLKLLAAYPIITDDFKIGEYSSQDWMVLNGSRQLNDVPASCILGSRDPSFVQAVDRLSDEGMQQRDYREGDVVVHGDGITVIKAGKNHVSLEILTSSNQLTDISLSADCNGDIKAIRLGGEFGCLMEDGDIKYTDWVRISTGGNFIRLLDDYTSTRKAMTSAATTSAKSTVYCMDDSFLSDDISSRLAFLRGLRAPFEYFELGMGWQSHVGDWDSFEGLNLSHTASVINKNGYKAGLWTAPFLVEKDSELFETEKKWILRHADGSVCTYDIGDKKYAVLDISSEECLEWVSMLYRRLSAYGYYMHHVDHTMAFVIQKDVILLDPTLSITAAYERAMKAIKESIGEDGYLCISNGFIPSLCGIADSVQIVSDISFLKSKSDCNVISKLINQAALRSHMSDWWHNLCAITIDNEFVAKYASAEAKKLMVCEYLTGGAPMVRNMKTNEQLKVLKCIVPYVESKVYPRDAFNETAYINVVDVEINDDYHTLCFFNNSFSDAELIFRLDNKTCGGYIDHASSYNVSSYFGRVKTSDCVYDDVIKLGTIPANSCEIVKIAKNNKPRVILSDMHFSMGGEVEIKLSGTKITVSGNNLFNIKGNYVIALPKGLQAADGRREFNFTVNGQGSFVYEKEVFSEQIKETK